MTRRGTKITTPRICLGNDHGDGRCADCDLPMNRHPVTFDWPQGKEPKT
jgi:hypothetical protein